MKLYEGLRLPHVRCAEPGAPLTNVEELSRHDVHEGCSESHRRMWCWSHWREVLKLYSRRSWM